MRPMVFRSLLVLLTLTLTFPAVYPGSGPSAEAAQIFRGRRPNTAAARRQYQQYLRKMAEAQRRAAQQAAAAANQQRAARAARAAAAAEKKAKKKPVTHEHKPDTEVHVVIKSWKDTSEYVSKRKGKVVVVDFWATWCQPCVKELPELVALQKKYPKDVVAISFSLDNDGSKDLKKEVLPRVLKTLKSINAVETHNIISKDSDEEVYKVTKLSSVPSILVFDQEGKLHKRIDVNSAGGKDVSYQRDVVPVVEKLLKNKKP